MLSDAIGKNPPALLERWIDMQVAASSYRPDRISPGELRDNPREFLAALEPAAASGSTDINGPAWAGVRHELGLSLPGVRTALNVECGMDLLRARLAERRRKIAADV